MVVAVASGDGVLTLKLVDGSVVQGEIVAQGEKEITVRTEFGVVRLPRAKLTAESKVLLGKTGGDEATKIAALRQRIAELEDELAAMKAENDELRKRLASTSAASTSPAGTLGIRGSSGGDSKARPKPEISGSHWMTSSSGKRHNSGCRYFRTSKGRPCGPSDGVACKICGG